MPDPDQSAPPAPEDDDLSRYTVPRGPVHRLLNPFNKFLHIEAAGGGVLLFFTVAALLLANSPAQEWFLGLWKTMIGFSIGDFSVSHSLKHWINDGLMTLFFFVIGLEVKREIVTGELREPRQAILPVAAALGGMIVPALLYLAFVHEGPGARGWGITMATDIAFLLGCVSVLGSRVPVGLRIFLVSLAVVDDIGAILVIAIGYTDSLNLPALGLGLGGIVLVSILSRLGVRPIPVYAIMGGLIWFAFHESGIHATLAGVILGLQTPARSLVSHNRIQRIVEKAGHFFVGEGYRSDKEIRATLESVHHATREATSPLARLENGLHPWVGFLIMPLFAFANAGVTLDPSQLSSPVSMAVMAGLVFGKPIGIVLFSLLVVKTGWTSLPKGVTWLMVIGGGCLAGIGFTMALFIADLSLGTHSDLLNQSKIAILFASGISAVLGILLLLRALKSAPPGDPVTK
jgi:NhaA family Na+:H+ antiporter